MMHHDKLEENIKDKKETSILSQNQDESLNPELQNINSLGTLNIPKAD